VHDCELPDQSDIFAFLADPATHGLCEPVKRIDTHGAAVFLAGKNVYKVKKAVRFAFMDFSTLAKRREACERELAVNAANAPCLYLGTVPISQINSTLNLGEGGKTVEWAVHMRRFDENQTFDHLAERGELNLDLIAKLAAAVFESHRRAPVVSSGNAFPALRGLAEETLDALKGDEAFAREAVMSLRQAMLQAFAHKGKLLEQREAKGKVRRCHGDLHLRNIAFIEGQPVLFDAIEFDEKIAICDIFYDLAFLLMDLWTRGLRRHANLLFNRYLWVCDEVEEQIKGLQLLPLFLSLRAAIRAKVAVLQPGGAQKHAKEARLYFDAATDFIKSDRPALIAIGGLSGTGKSSLAALLAGSIGGAPGAIHLRSDVERKRLFHVKEFDRLPEEAYRQEATARTYRRLRELAAGALAAGHSVIVDAVHLRQEERAAIEEVARQAYARFAGLWLAAPLDLLVKRVDERQADASDATRAVVEVQAKHDAGKISWHSLDASKPLEANCNKATASIPSS